MKRFTALLALLLVVALAETAFSQVIGGTGAIGFRLDVYGGVRVYVPNYYTGVRQSDANRFVAGLDSLHVFDYTQDADSIGKPSLTTGGIADTVATMLTSNKYSKLPPDVQVRVTVYAWKNDGFVIVKYTTINISTAAYGLYLGMVMVPRLSNVYGGETVAYDATKQIAYCYRTGQNLYLGIKLLTGAPYSYHGLDYAVYSPVNPASDAATDSMRWAMTSHGGFDAPVTAGTDGSIFILNAGKKTIAVGDSVTLYYALMQGTSLSALQTTADAAVTRYNSKFTSVRPTSEILPEHFALVQNYPNPFNPATRIGFQIKTAAFTTLKVYNMLGSEVATLVSNELAPGSYEVPFVANDLSSGVYVYRLTAGTYVETRRMMLMK